MEDSRRLKARYCGCSLAAQEGVKHKQSDHKPSQSAQPGLQVNDQVQVEYKLSKIFRNTLVFLILLLSPYTKVCFYDTI